MPLKEENLQSAYKNYSQKSKNLLNRKSNRNSPRIELLNNQENNLNIKDQNENKQSIDFDLWKEINSNLMKQIKNFEDQIKQKDKIIEQKESIINDLRNEIINNQEQIKNKEKECDNKIQELTQQMELKQQKYIQNSEQEKQEQFKIKENLEKDNASLNFQIQNNQQEHQKQIDELKKSYLEISQKQESEISDLKNQIINLENEKLQDKQLIQDAKEKQVSDYEKLEQQIQQLNKQEVELKELLNYKEEQETQKRKFEEEFQKLGIIKSQSESDLEKLNKQIQQMQILMEQKNKELLVKETLMKSKQDKLDGLEKQNQEWKDLINSLKGKIQETNNKIQKAQSNKLINFEEYYAQEIIGDEALDVNSKNQLFKCIIRGEEYIKKIQILKDTQHLSKFSVNLFLYQMIAGFNNKYEKRKFSVLKGLAMKISSEKQNQSQIQKKEKVQTDNQTQQVIYLTTFQERMDCDLNSYIKNNKNIKKFNKQQLTLQKIDIAIRICEALNELQINQFCYCDLKPENILIKYKENKTDIEDVILTDFEEVQLLKYGIDKPTMETHQTGQTLRYASPEAGYKEINKININSDVWCFGNVLFTLFFEQRPYHSLQKEAIIKEEIHYKAFIGNINPLIFGLNNQKINPINPLEHKNIQELLLNHIFINQFEKRKNFSQLIQLLQEIQQYEKQK